MHNTDFVITNAADIAAWLNDKLLWLNQEVANQFPAGADGDQDDDFEFCKVELERDDVADLIAGLEQFAGMMRRHASKQKGKTNVT